MIIEGTVFEKKVYINTDKIDYFYEEEEYETSKVVIGETVFLVEVPFWKLRDMIQG